MPETFAEKLARLKAEAGESSVAVTHETPLNNDQPSTSTIDSDLIPDVGSDYQPTQEDEEIDRLINGLDILEVYRRWCGKMEPKVGNKRESIMISCPRPDHADKTPSAWLNLDKNTWYCGRCEDGGDGMTLVARTKGYEGSSYQEGRAFPDLKRDMASDLGYVVRTTPGGESYLLPMETEPEPRVESPVLETEAGPPLDDPSATLSNPAETPSDPAPLPASEPASEDEGSEGKLAPIIALRATDEPQPVIPRIEWVTIVPPDSFLYTWMNVMRLDDLPEEFYFWHGLMALGMAGGRDAILADRQPVTGNLFCCLYGPSGQGKTRSTSQLSRLLRVALPYDKSDPDDTGTYMVPTPGSPEALIDSFSRPVPDPADPKRTERFGKVRGVIRFDELATLIGRASRTGNPLKPALQQFYDADPLITTTSRGHGDVEAHEAFCSVITTTQPRAIRQVLLSSDVDSGFANRWVYVMGHSKPPIPFGGADLDITVPAEKLKTVRSWAAFGRNIGLTPDAYDRWSEFYASDLAALHNTDDSMISRVPLLMKKLILLLALNSMEMQASVDTVESAILLFPYIMATYKYLSGDLGTGERQELDRAIIHACQSYESRTKKWPTSREIFQNLGKQHKDTGLFRRALEDLVHIGILDEQVYKPARGRPSTRYAVKEG